MLSTENKMIEKWENFNDSTIEHFARAKARRIDFIFK